MSLAPIATLCGLDTKAVSISGGGREDELFFRYFSNNFLKHKGKKKRSEKQICMRVC